MYRYNCLSTHYSSNIIIPVYNIPFCIYLSRGLKAVETFDKPMFNFNITLAIIMGNG